MRRTLHNKRRLVIPFVAGSTPLSGGEVPFDGILRADFETGADLTVYGGSPTGTLSNATVHDGYLDLSNGSKSVTWASEDNWQPTTVGCVNLLIEPLYTGNPSTAQWFIFKGRNGNSLNRIELSHEASGNFQLSARQASGLTFIFGEIPNSAWSPTAGVTYEIELNFDFAAGETRIFIDGTQKGNTVTGTGTLSVETTNVIRIGESLNIGSSTSNFYCHDFKVWDTVQHTSDY